MSDSVTDPPPPPQRGPALKRTASGSGAPPPAHAPLARQGSGSAIKAPGMPPAQYDWRLFLTIEERQRVRRKIRDAYAASCADDFQTLLDTCVAIEEELLHISAPSRLDYFKSGFEFENRVQLKRRQLDGAESDGEGGSGSGSSAAKRQRT